MSNLDPRIEAVRAKYDLAREDFWQIKQNKQWVCKHAALEIVAVKAGIEWLPPQIIEANAPSLVTSMVVTGKMGNRVEWATGETNATNYSVSGKQPAYPWAMAEKRAKDRVVLKLVGIHGLVYSEDEAEDFKERAAPQATTPPPVLEHGPGGYDEMVADLKKCRHPDDVTRWWDDPEVIEYCTKITPEWAMKLKAEVVAYRKHLMSKDTVSAIKDQFPGANVVNETHKEAAE